MALDFEKLKQIPDEIKNLMHGFMHQTERELSFTIPDLITTICIFYYYQFEHFSVCGQRIGINENGNIATVVMDDDKVKSRKNTVYGSIPICESYGALKYIWEFKIHKCSWREDIYIGIDSSNKQCINTDFSDEFMDDETIGDYLFYAWGTDANQYSNATDLDEDSNGKPEAIQQGDIIKMEINITNRTLIYYKNGKVTVSFTGLSFEEHVYHLAIALESEETSIELTNFVSRP